MPSKYLHRRIKHALRWKAAQAWMLIHPNLKVVAIGGSVGKTTTKDLVAAILSQQYSTVKSKANFDPIFNLPQTALTIRNHQVFVAEMGIDAPGQMEKYLTLIKPQMAIMTELSIEHTDAEHLQSLDTAVEEEWKLLKALPDTGWAIVNGDNDLIKQRLSGLSCNVLTYGFNQKNDIQIIDTQQTIKGGKAWLTITLQGKLEGCYEVPLLGRHNALCATAAICIGWKYSVDTKTIQAGLHSFIAPPHRLEIKPTAWGIIIDDTYNSSPKAAMAAIDTLVEVGTKQSTLVLGDMLELGEYAKSAHIELGEYAAMKDIQRVLVFGEFASDIEAGYKRGKGQGSLEVVTDREQISAWIKEHRPNIVLFKASRGVKLDTVVDSLVIST